MSTYAQRLSNRLAQRKQQQEEHSKAAERLKSPAAKAGIPVPELMAWYADDLHAIEHDPEITDSKLLAYVEDYANNRQKFQQRAAGGASCN